MKEDLEAPQWARSGTCVTRATKIAGGGETLCDA